MYCVGEAILARRFARHHLIHILERTNEHVLQTLAMSEKGSEVLVVGSERARIEGLDGVLMQSSRFKFQYKGYEFAGGFRRLGLQSRI